MTISATSIVNPPALSMKVTRQCYGPRTWALGVYVHNGTDEWQQVGGVPIGPHTYVALRDRPIFEAQVKLGGVFYSAPGGCYQALSRAAHLVPVAVRPG